MVSVHTSARYHIDVCTDTIKKYRADVCTDTIKKYLSSWQLNCLRCNHFMYMHGHDVHVRGHTLFLIPLCYRGQSHKIGYPLLCLHAEVHVVQILLLALHVP